MLALAGAGLLISAGAVGILLILITSGNPPHQLIAAMTRSDPPQRSDVLLILGGDYQTRVPAATRLFHEGYAPKVMLLREPTAPEMVLQHRPNFTQISLEMLKAAGVPEARIVYFAPGQGVRTTGDEARAFALYRRLYPVTRLLIVTSSFHCIRARMVFRRALPDVDVRVVGVESMSVKASDWSRTRFGRDYVRLECIKLLYYFVTFYG